MDKALLLVDIQRDYFPGGRMELVGALAASQAAQTLLHHFRATGWPIIHIQHISLQKGATFFLPDTEGSYIHENVEPLPGEVILRKHTPNSFLGTDLNEHLLSLRAKEIVICGMMSHMCIDATVRAAFDQGYACLVPHDACATRNLVWNGTEIPANHVHGAFMAALAAVYAKVLRAEDVYE